MKPKRDAILDQLITKEIESTEEFISQSVNINTPEIKPLQVSIAIEDEEALEKEMIRTRAKLKLDALIRHDHLAKITQSDALASELRLSIKPQNEVEARLIEQMAALHQTGMLITGTIIGHCGSQISPQELNLLANSAAKLFNNYRNSMQTLHNCRQTGQQTITVKHQHVQIIGGENIITDVIGNGMGGGNEKN